MRRGQGFFATLLLIVPMTAVPVMAVFGIPQFVPAARSSPAVAATAHHHAFIESRVGQSDAPVTRQLAIPASGLLDIFQPPGSDGSDASARSSSGSFQETEWVRSLQTTALQQRAAKTDRSLIFSQPPRTPVDRVQVIQTGYRTADVASSLHSDATQSAHPAPHESAENDLGINAAAGERYQRSTPPGQHPPLAIDGPRRPTWRQAVGQLNELGIRTFRLTPGAQPGTFQFSCLVSSVDDPRISRWFDAEAAEPLDAVARVLAKVEDWNRIR